MKSISKSIFRNFHQSNPRTEKKNSRETKKKISLELALNASNKPKNVFIGQKLVPVAQFENLKIWGGEGEVFLENKILYKQFFGKL